MLNKNNKKSTGIEGALFHCMGEMGMDNFGCLKSSLSFFFLFLFYNEPAKKNNGIRTLTVEYPLPPLEPVRF